MPEGDGRTRKPLQGCTLAFDRSFRLFMLRDSLAAYSYERIRPAQLFYLQSEQALRGIGDFVTFRRRIESTGEFLKAEVHGVFCFINELF